MKRSNFICAYCGQAYDKLTRDHVVPRTLWGGNLPANVVIVPACGECQQKWDLQAEYFRNTLIAMIDKGAHPVATKLLEGPVVRSLERSKKAIAAFFRNAQMMPRKSRGGIITGLGLGFQLDWARFKTVPEKIVRGLFFHKSGVPLPPTHSVSVFQGSSFWEDEGFKNLLAEMEPCAGCGDDVFQMRCARDMSDHCCTAWLLIFYQQLGFFVWTEAAKHNLS